MPQHLTARKTTGQSYGGQGYKGQALAGRAFGRSSSRMLLLGAGALALAAFGGPAAAQNILDDERTVPEEQVESAFGKYLSGRYAQYLGDLTGAADFFEGALAEEDQSESVRYRAYRLFLRAGKIERAAELAGGIEHSGRDGGLAPLVELVIAVKTGNFAAAERSLEEIEPRGFNSLLKPVAAAWIMLGRGSLEDTIAALEPLGSNNGFRAFQAHHAALIYDAAGAAAEAEAAYRSAVETREIRSLRGIEAFANFLIRDGRRVEAEATFNQYISGGGRSALVDDAWSRLVQPGMPEPFVADAAQGLAEGFYGAARALLQNNTQDIAVIYVQLAIALRPDFDAALMLLGNIFDVARQWENANTAYRRVDSGSELGWAARIRIANNLNRLDQAEAAMDILRRMSDERPKRIDALVGLADMLRFDKRWEEAVVEYNRAIERLDELTEENWTLLYSRGIALERSKKWARAESDFLRALEFSPDQPLVLNYLGYSWIERGTNFDEARDMIEKAVDLRPRDGYIVDSLGWVLYQIGEFDEAVGQLERAVQLRPDDPVINEHLGDAYWRVGRRLEARFQWERALIFEPEEDLIPVIQKKIRDGLEDI